MSTEIIQWLATGPTQYSALVGNSTMLRCSRAVWNGPWTATVTVGGREVFRRDDIDVLGSAKDAAERYVKQQGRSAEASRLAKSSKRQGA